MSNEMSQRGAVSDREAQRLRVELTGDFLLLLTLTWFFCGTPCLTAMGLAAAVHELGHLWAILAQGELPAGLRLDASGLCIRCRAGAGEGAELVRTLAGPGAGLLLWLLLRSQSAPFLRLCAVSSLSLSLVNLLPASCLDGGRLLGLAGSLLLGPGVSARISRWTDGICILLFALLGLSGRPLWLLWCVWLAVWRLGS